MNWDKPVNPLSAAGFALTSVFAVAGDWSLPEFCWSTWLAGLVFAWSCTAAAAVQIALSSALPGRAAGRPPFLRNLHPALFFLLMTAAAAGAGFFAFRVYGFLFGFYGLFLSVFAEMEPHELFGRNGFINSDFYTPVGHLLRRFWPMAAGVLTANGGVFFGREPWKRIVLPFERHIVRLHVMIVALPFFSLLAWFLFKESYPSATIILLSALLYFLPFPQPEQTDR